MEGQETGQWNFFIVFKRDLKVVVRSAKNYPAVMPGRYVTVGEEVDRCVEHKSSVLVAIRRDIRTATGQAQAQRRSRADLVKLDFYEAPVIQSAALLSAHAETNRRSTILPSKTQLSREKYVSPLATVQNLMHYSVLSAS
jgi:hypothetical protein